MAQRGAGFVEHLEARGFQVPQQNAGVRRRASWDWALFESGPCRARGRRHRGMESRRPTRDYTRIFSLIHPLLHA
jgi:hypothetical protein